MIYTIDFSRWMRRRGLSHMARSVYLQLLDLHSKRPERPIEQWRGTLGLYRGQWHRIKAELRNAGLLQGGTKLVIHDSIQLERKAS